MAAVLPHVFLARHGETAWTVSRQHTGLTDIPLTTRGEHDAGLLGGRLKGTAFARVFTSPLQRARRTCELAGFGGTAEVDPDLVEWDYGDFEGKTTADIRKVRPGWQLFRDGAPNGESIEAIGQRADRVIARLRAVGGDVLIFSSGHFSRVLAVRWLGLDVSAGRLLVLGTASLCILGYDHGPDEPAIHLWNDTLHIGR